MGILVSFSIKPIAGGAGEPSGGGGAGKEFPGGVLVRLGINGDAGGADVFKELEEPSFEELPRSRDPAFINSAVGFRNGELFFD